MSKKSVTLLLIGILFLAFFFRFWKLETLFHWTLDEEYWAYVAYNVAKGYHIPLIGGPASGTGVQLGPLFVWLMGIVFFFIGSGPIQIAAFVSAVGVLTTGTIYFLGKRVFDNRSALISSLVYAVGFWFVLYDRKYWNAFPIPLLSTLVLLALSKIDKAKLRWYVFLAVILAVAFHAHGTGIVIVGASLFIIFLNRQNFSLRGLLLGGLFFLLLQTPLVAFDLRHNFHNLRALTNFDNSGDVSMQFGKSVQDVATLTVNTFSRFVYLGKNTDIADELTLCREYANRRFLPSSLLALIPFFSIVTFLYKKQKTQMQKQLIVLIGVNILGLLLYRLFSSQHTWYGGQLNEYYLLPLVPAIVLIVGNVLSDMYAKSSFLKGMVVALLMVYSLINLFTILTIRHSDNAKLKQQRVTNIISLVGENPFGFQVISQDPCLQYGYRYLFTQMGREPQQSDVDPILGWLYFDRIMKQDTEKSVTLKINSQNNSEIEITEN